LSKHIIVTEQAPQAIGPYSQAVAWGQLIFCSAQIALRPEGGSELVGAGVAEQTEQCLRNLSGVLQAAGASMETVVRTTVFLTTLDNFAAMNEVYGRYFTADAPARSTVAVAGLPRGALVAIDAIAYRD
jgi:2-iminobutanoate/2-iminopropanoate deaminase